MEAVYGWVKNIIYYMIFLSVVNNLLADSKYGKYIRFFSGMVLILLVVSPFTGGLHLDEQISSMFKSISFQNDTDDLKQDLWGMDERRLDQVIREYEQAVAAELKSRLLFHLHSISEQVKAVLLLQQSHPAHTIKTLFR